MDSTLLITAGLLGLCALGLSWFAGSDAPYVPTKLNQLKKVFQKAGLKKGCQFYELGSGDGRVVLLTVQMGAVGYGIEQSWIRVWLSRYSARQRNLTNAHFFHGNIFDRHYYPADMVYIYMLQKAVDRLEKKLQGELKSGAKVVTQRYHFKNWKPKQKLGEFWIYQR